MPGIFPPIQSPMKEGDSPRVTKGWEGFFNDMYSTMGKQDGVVFFSGDTVKVDGTNKDLTIGSGSDTITVNGMEWTTSLTEGYVLQVDSSNVLSFVDPIAAYPSFEPGDIKYTYKTVADNGWLIMDDGTIGNASSGASTRANADTEDLFTQLWNNISNTYCAVSSGRGASAAADFAANKTIALPKIAGRSPGASGAGSGLTSRALGQTVGEEEHTLTIAEFPAHSHEVLVDFSVSGGSEATLWQIADNTESGGGTITSYKSTSTTGSSSAHENMQPYTVFNAMIKL
jgi:hypothetical protein